MPELPEVESVRRVLTAAVAGARVSQVVVRDGRLRWPVAPMLPEVLAGARLLQFRRRAKYLLVDLTDKNSAPWVLAVHLGMTGWWGVRQGTPWPHDHLLFRLDDGRLLAFNDPRRFGSLHLFLPHEEPSHPRLVNLGVEPLLDAAFSGAYLWRACRGRTSTIKERLMDAGCVVGVGNIYASEALFRAKVLPQLAAHKVSKVRAAAIVAAVQSVLAEAIAEGGTTFRDFRGSDGRRGQFVARLAVYGRAGLGCLLCATAIRQATIGGRSTFFCPRCQRR